MKPTKRRKRRYNKTMRRKKGGLFGQDLANLGRQSLYNVESIYNTLSGYKLSTNPFILSNHIR